jgi:hypothetical protein
MSVTTEARESFIALVEPSTDTVQLPDSPILNTIARRV